MISSALATGAALQELGAGRGVILDDMLGSVVAATAREAGLELDAAGELRPAGVGKDATAIPTVRGDRIAWIDPHAPAEPFRPVIELLRSTMNALNHLVHLGADDLECQLALYDTGSGYERHRDTIRSTSSRRVTAIYYLNDWHREDGGELELYGRDDEPDRIIEPIADRLVLFRSELTEHAVRTVHRGPRLAISAFFRRRPVF